MAADAALKVGPFVRIACEVGLALLLVALFDLEEQRGLRSILPLCFGGFVIHAWLPRGLRLSFFLLLSLAGFAVVFGVAPAALLVAIGLALVGIAHLPLPAAPRVLLLGLAVAVLVALRADWIPPGPLAAILPVLGSIFMFRLAIYVYDLLHEREPVPLATRLAYFFLLPNAVFPLFPIIDYKTFRRTYYDADAEAIYQKGVRWMLRGIVHLLAYRLVYQHLTVAPEAVHDLKSVLLYLSSAYLLYLRISGQFHLVIGMLCLFGFNLPETHHWYFLASGFNDLWRRINIYWKNFMMKLFFYPIFLRVNRRRKSAALPAATLAVFLLSWLLHSFQWFWIRGTFPFTLVDAIFWSIFALAVLANSLLEQRFGRPRAGSAVTLRGAFVRAVKTVAMFSFMCALWSFWIGSSVGEWLELVGRARTSPPAHFAWLALGLLGAVAIGTAVALAADRRPWARLAPGSAKDERSGARHFQELGTAATLLLLLLVAAPPMWGGESRPAPLVASIRTDHLNEADYTRLELGYYEELLESRDLRGRLWDIAAEEPQDWLMITEVDGVVWTGKCPPHAFVPSARIRFNGTTLVINKDGLRDREYEREKPPETFRAAVLGGSVEMGAGVENDEIFEALVEERLNEEASEGSPWLPGVARYELLNFGVAGYCLPEQTALAEERISDFHPDACFLFVHKLDRDKLVTMVRDALDHAERSNVAPEIPAWVRITAEEILALEGNEARARAVAADMIAWGFERIAAACRAHGIEPVCIFLHHPPGEPNHYQTEVEQQFEAVAQKTGFAFLALQGDAVYGTPRDERELIVAPWDRHPNAEGHRRIAEELLRRLKRLPLASKISAAGGKESKAD